MRRWIYAFALLPSSGCIIVDNGPNCDPMSRTRVVGAYHMLPAPKIVTPRNAPCAQSEEPEQRVINSSPREPELTPIPADNAPMPPRLVPPSSDAPEPPAAPVPLQTSARPKKVCAI
jgi:hypothetical protein